MTARPASGWYIEATTTGGYTHTTTALQNNQYSVSTNPQANSRPEIRVPVPKNDFWNDVLDDTTDIDVAIWHDGVRQPIDTLIDVQQDTGATVLHGKGGRELSQRVETSYDQQAIHTAVNNLIDTNTTYTSNVDTPSTTTETNTQLDTWTTNAGFRSRLEPQLLDTDPVEVTGGNLDSLQSAYHFDARDNSGGGADQLNTSQGGSSDWVDGFAARLDASGEFIEFDVTFDYTVPADQVGFAVRQGADDTPGVDYRINGVDVDRLAQSVGLINLNWDDIETGGFSSGGANETGGYQGGDFVGGEAQTVRIECIGAGTGEEIGIDWIVIYDKRYSYTFDNTTDGNNELSGPEKYPDSHRVSFRQIPATKSVTGIKAELTVDEGASPSGSFSIRVSNDQGANFTTNANSNTLETDSLGASFGPSVVLEVDLSRYGSQTETPTSGINGHSIQDVTLSADLSTMPIVVNRTFDGHLDSILSELADIGDFLWSFERDGATESVEWTQPGQRTTTETPGFSQFSATKSTDSVYQKAIVYGQSDVSVIGEQFESSHGNAVELANDRIQPGSERVINRSTGETYRSQVDYTMDYQAGEITVLSSGNMSNSTVFELEYEYQAYGEFDDGTVSPDVAPRANIPGLPSDFLCQQAARLIVNEVSTPLFTATVTIPNDQVGWSVVDSFDPDLVPTGGNALHVKRVENTPRETVLTLGSRRSVGEVVSDINQRVSAVSQKA